MSQLSEEMVRRIESSEYLKLREQGLNDLQISNRIGITNSVLHNYRKMKNIPSSNEVRARQLASQMREMSLDSDYLMSSNAKIAKALNCSIQTVENVQSEFSIPTPWEAVEKRVKHLHYKGKTRLEIAAALNIPKTKVDHIEKKLNLGSIERRPWTEAEERLIIENIETKGPSWIAKQMDRTTIAVNSRLAILRRQGQLSAKNSRADVRKRREEVRKMTRKGMTVKAIAETLNVPESTIHNDRKILRG
jgi:DNA-binding CsgD family transcriptional regulator